MSSRRGMSGAGEARCRLCLRRGAPALHPLFPRRRHRARYTLALALATGLQIELNDGLPQNICTECTDIVNECLHFRTKCHKAEIQLLQWGYRRKTQASHIETQTPVTNIEFSKENDWTGDSECDFMPLEFKKGYETCNTANETMKFEPHSLKNEYKNSDETNFDNCNSDNKIESQCYMQTNKQSCVSIGDSIKHYNENRDEKYAVSFDNNVNALQNKRIAKLKAKNKKSQRDHSKAMIENALKYYQTKLKFKRENVRHLSVGPVDSKGPYQCKVCKKIFTRWTNFYWHTKIHTGFDYVCEHCGKKCINTNVLLRHLRAKHGMERDLSCQYCDFKGLDKMQMTLHVRARHTGERPFVCDVCGASFTGKRLLIQHLPKHSDHRPVQCDACPSKFKTKHDLIVHKSKVHRPREWRYECYICNNSFTRAQNARAHIKKFHSIPVKEQEELRKIRLE